MPILRVKLTLGKVRSRVAAVKAAAIVGDHERAHNEEDKLYLDVLRQLADEGSELAKTALGTQEMNIKRYCA